MDGSQSLEIIPSVRYIQLYCLLPILHLPFPAANNFVPYPNEHDYLKEIQKVVDTSNKQLHKINYPNIP